MQNDTVKEMNPKLGQFIKAERAKKSWTQEHLATAAGVAERTIQRLEKGELPSKETLLGIAAALEVDVEKLTMEPQKVPEKPKGKIVLLPQILSGKDALDITWGAHLGEYDHPQLLGGEAEVVGGFLVAVKDLGEIGPEIGIGFKIECSGTLHEQLQQVQSAGYLVFGNRRNVIFGSREQKTSMSLATMIVVKNDDPKIIQDGVLRMLPMWISFEPKPVSW